MAARRTARPNVQKNARKPDAADRDRRDAVQARWDAVLGDQLSLPFDTTDAHLLDGYSAVRRQLDERRAQRGD